MPYYSESESQQLREKFEEIVLPWPDVTKKKMFGSPTYSTGGTTFAMLVDGGIILPQLDDEKKAALLSNPDAEYFVDSWPGDQEVGRHQDSGYRRYRALSSVHRG